MKNDVWIKARVTPELKARFRTTAANAGRTESGQLKWLLQSALLSPEERAATSPSLCGSARGARVWVRLGAEDRRLLRERAAARQLAAATYVALLVRAHLRERPPLPKAELAALTRTVAEVASIGRNLNQFVRAVQAGGHSPGFTVEHAKTLIRVCEALRDRSKELIAANVESWRGGDPYG